MAGNRPDPAKSAIGTGSAIGSKKDLLPTMTNLVHLPSMNRECELLEMLHHQVLLVKREQRAQKERLIAMAATLDQILADVTEEATLIDGVSTLITGLKQQLADALSGVNLPPAVQAKVDSVFNAAETNKAKLAAALTVNTPSAPSP